MKDKLYVKINENFQNLGECVLNSLKISNGDFVSINYSRTSQSFNISTRQESCVNVPCYHSASCPMLRVQQELGLFQTIPKFLPVLSSVIVKSLDSKVLIMRHTETLGLASKCWGFSYRKIQMKESIFKGGLRALREDAGINIVESGNSMYFLDNPVEVNPVCIYESVFPKILEYGLPRNQGIIVFSEVYLPYEAEEIKLKRNNVDFLVWIEKDDFSDVQQGRKVLIDSTELNVRFDQKCFKGFAPNKIGEGFGEGHYYAIVKAFEGFN